MGGRVSAWLLQNYLPPLCWAKRSISSWPRETLRYRSGWQIRVLVVAQSDSVAAQSTLALPGPGLQGAERPSGQRRGTLLLPRPPGCIPTNRPTEHSEGRMSEGARGRSRQTRPLWFSPHACGWTRNRRGAPRRRSRRSPPANLAGDACPPSSPRSPVCTGCGGPCGRPSRPGRCHQPTPHPFNPFSKSADSKAASPPIPLPFVLLSNSL